MIARVPTTFKYIKKKLLARKLLFYFKAQIKKLARKARDFIPTKKCSLIVANKAFYCCKLKNSSLCFGTNVVANQTNIAKISIFRAICLSFQQSLGSTIQNAANKSVWYTVWKYEEGS